MIRYDEFPVVLFFRLSQKGDAVAERFLRKHGHNNWAKIREQWEANHQDDKGDPFFEKKKSITLEIIRFNKIVLVINWLRTTKRDIKDIFKTLNLPWSDDPVTRNQTLEKLRNKANEKIKIFSAQLKKMQEDSGAEDEEPQELSLAQIYEAFASLETLGFDIPNYNEVTLSKYDAMTKVADRKIKANSNGGRAD